MQKKLSSYFFLSFFSFCLFTVIFHTVAHAQSSTTLHEQSTQKLHPSPTLYVAQPPQTTTVQANRSNIIQPTPTVYIAPAQATPTPSPITLKELQAEPEVTTLPTVAPTVEVSPTVTPQPIIPVVTDLESLFTKYSGEFGVEKDLLKKIAQCESGFNTNSNNSGIYLGMFQFSASTWTSNRTKMGLDPNPDLRTNAEEAIRTAAFMISRGGRGAWPNCN